MGADCGHSYEKSVVVQTNDHIPFCCANDCKPLVMLQKGHVYCQNQALTVADGVYAPMSAGDTFAGVLTCGVDATDWAEDCEQYVCTSAKGNAFASVVWPVEMTDEQAAAVIAQDPCCWTWRPLPKPCTQMPICGQ